MTLVRYGSLRLAALLVLLSGCHADPYCLDCDDDAGARDLSASLDGNGNADGSGPCVPTGAEVCNGKDDDCNGLVDDGYLPSVGGTCGYNKGICTPGMLACVGGALVCSGGAINPVAEQCNGIDDDCDGIVDNGNPGGGVLCGNGTGDCVQGLTACVNGGIVCQGGSGPTMELCDGHDNDCNGMIDDGDPGGGASCGAGPGVCVLGKVHCVGGQLQCIGAGPAVAELCNGIDDNCNGHIDEGFNLANDVDNCGMCGNACALPDATSLCAAGVCQVAHCAPDHWDLDGLPENGCEYSCVFRGVELCNGIDDNCDGQIDESVTPPDICSKLGECLGTTAACGGANGWVCHYGASVSQNAAGEIIPETNCDGHDNDCNGIIDDAFGTRGKACTAGQGACVTQGIQVCNSTQNGLICNAPTPPTGTPETCNGIDDDCDGVIDNGAPDDWVTLSVSGTMTQIYRYEASHPDANATTIGSLTHRSCSASNRLPWVNVPYPDAAAACTAAGARLCTEAEWQTACESFSGTCNWSEASSCTSYQTQVCNDANYDIDTMTPGIQNGTKPTGFFSSCYSDWGGQAVYDMSGNVKEWAQARSSGINPLRGGSYNNPSGGTECTSNFVVADDTFLFANVGFRCCR